MKSSKAPSYLAVVTAIIIWGFTASIMKLTLEHVPPFTLATLRFSIAALLLYPFVMHALKLHRKDIPLMLISGLVGITLHIGALFLGLRETTALNAGVIIGTTPIFTFLFAHLFLKEELHKNILFAAVLGMAGILIVTGSDFLTGGITLSIYGDLLVVIGMLSFVMYEILSKKLFKKYNPTTVTFYSFAIGTVSFLPLAIKENMSDITWAYALPDYAILGILYGIFISSLTAYSLWEWGLSKVDASKVGFFLYLDPVAAVIGAVVILGESITPPFILGGLLIALGIFLAHLHFPHIHIHRARHK